ncbi:hypothetical protein [Streptomyces sioyaensis]|uniref:hypothetical protein n=1 Tax=Streptomyces sioyaensis TaxID=67364 RepID=UPI001F3B112F|nr:hypothetical protein [Streptomyces sioyaensis]
MAMRVLSCFADRLGFDADFFTRAHDPSRETHHVECVVVLEKAIKGRLTLRFSVRMLCGAGVTDDILTLVTLI